MVGIVEVTVFLFIGTVGNVLTFIAVTNKHCKQSSYTVYLAALAVADLLTMFSASISRYASTMNLRSTSEIYCKLNLFLGYTFAGISIWLIILLAGERAFYMYFPFKVKSVCKPRNALIATTVVVLAVTACDSHYIYGLSLKSISPNGNGVMKTATDRAQNVNAGVNVSLSPPEATLCGRTINGEDVHKNVTSENVVGHDGMGCQGDIDDDNTGGAEGTNMDNTETIMSSPCKPLDLQAMNLTENVTVTVEDNTSGGCRKLSTQSPSFTDDIDVNATKPTTPTREIIGNYVIETYCGFLDKNYVNFYHYWSRFEIVFFFLLPVIIMVTANTATWVKAYKTSRGNLATVTAQTLRRTRHVIILTSLISIAFFVFVTPMTIWFLIDLYIIDQFKAPVYSEETKAVLMVIAEFLYHANHSLNFFFYILSGSRFRNSLKAAFCKAKKTQVDNRQVIILESYTKEPRHEETGIGICGQDKQNE